MSRRPSFKERKTCGQERPMTWFYTDQRKADNRSDNCQQCRRLKKLSDEKKAKKDPKVKIEPKVHPVVDAFLGSKVVHIEDGRRYEPENVDTNEPDIEYKRCSKCKDFKSPDEFQSERHGRDGKKSICRSCCSARDVSKRKLRGAA